MSNLLDSAAIGSKSGDEAKELLEAYVATAPAMLFNHTYSAMTQQPGGTGAGDQLIKPR